MARDHYIPAGFLGGFSENLTGRRRDRLLWASLRGGELPEQRRAHSLGYATNLYKLDPQDAVDNVDEIDSSWKPYEARLSSAIHEVLSSGPYGLVDTWQWMHTMVPFVAGLYVRGLDFSHAKTSYHLNDDGTMRPAAGDSNSNLGRRAEQTRLLAPLLCAEWKLHWFGEAELITSDIGFTLTTVQASEVPSGIAVPIGRHHALLIRARSTGVVSRAIGTKWMTAIPHVTESPENADLLNRSIARSSQSFIAGAKRDVMRRTAEEYASPYKPPGAPLHLMWGTEEDLMMNESEWWQLRGAMSHAPNDAVQRLGPFKFNNDYPVESDEWIPNFMITPGKPTNLTALSKIGGILSLDLDLTGNVRRVHKAAYALPGIFRNPWIG